MSGDLTWTEVVDGAVLALLIMGILFFVAVLKRGWPGGKGE